MYHRNITAVKDQEEITAYCILTGFDTNPPPMVHEWYFQNEVRFSHDLYGQYAMGSVHHMMCIAEKFAVLANLHVQVYLQEKEEVDNSKPWLQKRFSWHMR